MYLRKCPILYSSISRKRAYIRVITYVFFYYESNTNTAFKLDNDKTCTHVKRIFLVSPS